MFIKDCRREYERYYLEDTQALEHPMEQFERWFESAKASGIVDVNAMTLSTVGQNMQPSSRIVLMKQYHLNGLVFFTNYGSRKSQEIELNKAVSLTFFWSQLEQEIHIEGVAKKVSTEVSEAYFKTRPRESQIAAWASHQSNKIKSRKELDAYYDEMAKKFTGDVPLPEFCGGYEVQPQRVEFWQGRVNRMHDRIVYERIENEWQIGRLSP